MTQVDVDIIILLLIAAMNAYTAYMTRKVEKNINSMKDALVAATAKASFAEGREEVRNEAKETSRG